MANKIYTFDNPAEFTYDDTKIEVSGGSDSQIQITDAINGKFIINTEKNETKDMDINSNIEIEVETLDNKVYTIYKNTIIFIPQKINWEAP